MVNLDQMQHRENVKKKKNKRKLVEETKDQTEEQQLEVTEVKKKKKKKNKADANVEEKEVSVSEEEKEAPAESPFKKDFYSMQPTTEAMSKKSVKEYRQLHNITLYGKGRKAFKPLLTFAELGFPSSIMNICKQFQKPSPIQVRYNMLFYFLILADLLLWYCTVHFIVISVLLLVLSVSDLRWI